MLPLEILQQAAAEMTDYHGCGMSVAGNCLTKTQGCAKLKDYVYSLTPARCWKVKRRCHRKRSIELKPQ